MARASVSEGRAVQAPVEPASPSMSHAPADFFAVLQLAAACELDAGLLERNYRSLQGQWHPDRHSGGTAEARLAAVQMSSLINDAYTTLKSPLARAAHLLALRGCDVGQVRQADLAPEFLLQQMQLRDRLEQVGEGKGGAADEAAIASLAAETRVAWAGHWQALVAAVGADQFDVARREFHKLQFMSKLQDEIRAVEDRLSGY